MNKLNVMSFIHRVRSTVPHQGDDVIQFQINRDAIIFLHFLSQRLKTHDKKEGKTWKEEKKSNDDERMVYFVPVDKTLKYSCIDVQPSLAVDGIGCIIDSITAVACNMGIDQNNNSKEWKIFKTVLVMTSNSTNECCFPVGSRLGELMSQFGAAQSLWKSFQ